MGIPLTVNVTIILPLLQTRHTARNNPTATTVETTPPELSVSFLTKMMHPRYRRSDQSTLKSLLAIPNVCCYAALGTLAILSACAAFVAFRALPSLSGMCHRRLTWASRQANVKDVGRKIEVNKDSSWVQATLIELPSPNPDCTKCQGSGNYLVETAVIPRNCDCSIQATHCLVRFENDEERKFSLLTDTRVYPAGQFWEKETTLTKCGFKFNADLELIKQQLGDNDLSRDLDGLTKCLNAIELNKSFIDEKQTGAESDFGTVCTPKDALDYMSDRLAQMLRNHKEFWKNETTLEDCGFECTNELDRMHNKDLPKCVAMTAKVDGEIGAGDLESIKQQLSVLVCSICGTKGEEGTCPKSCPDSKLVLAEVQKSSCNFLKKFLKAIRKSFTDKASWQDPRRTEHCPVCTPKDALDCMIVRLEKIEGNGSVFPTQARLHSPRTG